MQRNSTSPGLCSLDSSIHVESVAAELHLSHLLVPERRERFHSEFFTEATGLSRAISRFSAELSGTFTRQQRFHRRGSCWVPLLAEEDRFLKSVSTVYYFVESHVEGLLA